MSHLVQELASIVALNGGEIVGKTRFQKTVYLLSSYGIDVPANFEYYNYGPYSAELAFALDDATALGLLSVEERQGNYHVPYAVFRTNQQIKSAFSVKDEARIRKILQVLSGYSALILELAATALFLGKNQIGHDPWEETARRKPGKADPARLASARRLLSELENL